MNQSINKKAAIWDTFIFFCSGQGRKRENKVLNSNSNHGLLTGQLIDCLGGQRVGTTENRIKETGFQRL